MKQSILVILTFLFLCSKAQNLNTVKFNNKYKIISLSNPIVNNPVKKDTIKFTDTIYIESEKLKDEKIGLLTFPYFPQKVYSPLKYLEITSPYGMRFHPIKKRWLLHSGVDFRAYKDTVLSVLDGIIHSSGYNKALGYFIKVQSGNYILTYAHLSQYFYLYKMKVDAGQALGITGNTGLSTGEHLHFAVYHNGNPIEPLGFLKTLIQLQSTYSLIPSTSN